MIDRAQISKNLRLHMGTKTFLKTNLKPKDREPFIQELVLMDDYSETYEQDVRNLINRAAELRDKLIWHKGQIAPDNLSMRRR